MLIQGTPESVDARILHPYQRVGLDFPSIINNPHATESGRIPGDYRTARLSILAALKPHDISLRGLYPSPDERKNALAEARWQGPRMIAANAPSSQYLEPGQPFAWNVGMRYGGSLAAVTGTELKGYPLDRPLPRNPEPDVVVGVRASEPGHVELSVGQYACILVTHPNFILVRTAS